MVPKADSGTFLLLFLLVLSITEPLRPGRGGGGTEGGREGGRRRRRGRGCRSSLLSLRAGRGPGAVRARGTPGLPPGRESERRARARAARGRGRPAGVASGERRPREVGAGRVRRGAGVVLLPPGTGRRGPKPVPGSGDG